MNPLWLGRCMRISAIEIRSRSTRWSRCVAEVDAFLLDLLEDRTFTARDFGELLILLG
jgi:hypothetical protein